MDNTNHVSYGAPTDIAPDHFRHELQVFIVGASSWNQLSIIVQAIIKPSIWWNHMASFFVLDRSPGCTNYGYFLLGAWYLGILNAKVMCSSDHYRGSIFNYNPFTDRAPGSWQKSHIWRGKNNHPFTLFVWDYREDDAICEDLDFPKTNDFGGHEIAVEGYTGNFNIRMKSWSGLSKHYAERERILQIIHRSMNVTPKFSNLIRKTMPPDAEMNIRYAPLGMSRLAITYPYQQVGLVIVTKFRGHKSQLDKILSVTDVDSRIGIVIVYLITLVFLKFFVHQGLALAMLNLVRMTCDTGLSNLSDCNASRMFLTGLLFFVVTIQGIYQGNLASLLTNKIPIRNVNSLKDLVNFGYKTIYGLDYTDHYIVHSELKERFIMVGDSGECIESAANDTSAACIIAAEGIIYDFVRRNGLHMSSQFVALEYVGFVIKKFWYAEQQINRILMSIMEADIFEPWDGKCNPTTLADFQFDTEVLNNTDYKIIEFAELRFAFVILGIGLTCATVVFVVELSLQYISRFLRRARVALISRRDGSIATMRKWIRACARTHVKAGYDSRRWNPPGTITKGVRITVIEKEGQVNTMGS